MSRRSAAASILFITALIWQPPAALAGADTHYQDYLVGEGAAGMGGAFTALANEASGGYYNPAGILRPGTALMQLSMSAYKLRLLTRDLAEVCGEKLKSDDQAFFGFPGSLAIVFPFKAASLDHAIGFTLVVPYWDRRMPDFQIDGAKCGDVSMSVAGSELRVDRVFTAGLTYAVRPLRGLQVGLTVGAAIRSFTTSGMLSIIPDAAVTSEGRPLPAVLHRNGEVTLGNLFFQAGAIYQPLPGLRLGLSFTSPQIRLGGRGRLDLILVSTDPFNVTKDPTLVSDDAEYYWKVPFKITLGAAYTHRKLLTVALDVSLHGPQGRYQTVEHPDLADHADADNLATVERKLVVNVNLGLEALVWHKLILRFGLFTNFSSFPDESDLPLQQRTGDQAHTDMFGATLGGTFLSSKASTLSFGVQAQLGNAKDIAHRIYSKDGTSGAITWENMEANALDFALIVTVGGSYDIR